MPLLSWLIHFIPADSIINFRIILFTPAQVGRSKRIGLSLSIGLTRAKLQIMKRNYVTLIIGFLSH